MVKTPNSKGAGDAQTEYSPSSAKTYRFCQKKFYFTWLTRHTQGWRKGAEHPWHQVYRLKQLKHRQTWAGDLYHQVIAHTLKHISNGSNFDEDSIRQIAKELAAAQFEFSSSRAFVTATKSRVATYHGISTFLALFDHAYNLPIGNLLQETQQKIDIWLANTFTWTGWSRLIDQVRTCRNLYIEPYDLVYSLGDVQISARMDVGIEDHLGNFTLYDWKCYSENDQFADYNEQAFKHQLLVYALWPVQRAISPIPLDRVTAYVFNPVNGIEREVHFTEGDQADFELEAHHWGRLQARLFSKISDVEFEDLEGPYDSQRSCPWCPFKAVCSQEIVWHELS